VETRPDGLSCLTNWLSRKTPPPTTSPVVIPPTRTDELAARPSVVAGPWWIGSVRSFGTWAWRSEGPAAEANGPNRWLVHTGYPRWTCLRGLVGQDFEAARLRPGLFTEQSNQRGLAPLAALAP
jgi:hypothetical protein